jgi:hypothetical protein
MEASVTDLPTMETIPSELVVNREAGAHTTGGPTGSVRDAVTIRSHGIRQRRT